MEYFLFQWLFAFLWGVHGVSVLEILSYEHLLLWGKLISTPNSSEPQICSGRFSTVIWLRLDAKISRLAQSVANSSVALPAWMLHGHQMAPIQLDSVTILLKKLLVGHTRSISGPILRGRYFRLTTSSILSEKICCLWCIRLLCTPPCGIPRLPPASFYVGPHSVNPLPIAPNEVVKKQWYHA